MHCSRELLCLGIICLLVGGHHMAEAGGLYTNPFDLENEWTNYGIGDPYILRWNGRYYLYPSTNTHYGGSMGIRTWISQDLINWDYAGYATTEPVTKNAFAPEVVYWNGFFYMYTSPDGQGHYVLKSDRPTGPFTVQTDNLGLTIDGSVFIDDDGRWYFTHAGHLGIRGHRMADPYTVGPERVLNSSLGGWTEGSYILKRNDLYYLTYTGNHLLSTGYRVHYSMSEEGPLGPYIVPEDDLILISTKEGFSGLGHSATVLGPDLDSYYIVYHSMPIRFGPHLRKMNIDRLAFNGKKMMVLGPTNYPQKGPKLPEFYTWIDEDGLSPHWVETKSGDSTLLLSRSKTGPDYTAEFNFAVTDKTAEGYMGTLFSYIDDQNFACVLLDLQEKSLELQVTRQGQLMRLATASLFEEVDLTRLHTLRVVKYGDRMEIYFDNMRQFALDLKGVFGGSIGYIYDRVEPLLSFTAFSSEAKGSSDYDVPKPIPGTIQGVHYRKDGYCVRQSVDDNPLRYRDGTRIHEGENGTYSVELVDEGDWLSYNINVEEEDTYGVALTVPVDSEATVQIWVDDSPVLIGDVINKDVASKDGWVKVRVGTLELPKGLHTLKVQLVEGRLNLESFEFYPVMTEPFTASTGLGDDWQYYGELDWQSSERGYGITRPKEMMAITGEEGWTDYRVEVDLYVDGQIYPGEAGLVVRATHPSYFQGQVKDAVIGYYVAFNGRSISLKKLRYNSQTLAQVNTQDIVASRHHLAVEVVGSTIKVYWDGSQQPIIEYTDPNGLLHGAVGLRTNTPAIYFKDFALTCLSSLVYGQVQIGDHTLWISPTRQKYEVKLPFGVVDPPTVMVVPQDALLAEVKLDS
ncbi:MAG: family 43 glycosylhydrolase, partial [Limnochordia bacterium]|nr:family 43 glycosylhydrolase [Limnochordia bacterium]